MSGNKLRTEQRLWATLESQPFPCLHGLAPTDRDCFVLLDAYLRDCVEEWFATCFQLSARSIVLLDDCTRTITRRFQLLDSEGQCYFGQFRRLARRILQGVDVEKAYHQAEQEMDTELGWEHMFDEPFPDLARLSETATR